jgi:hypothetical protein
MINLLLLISTFFHEILAILVLIDMFCLPVALCSQALQRICKVFQVCSDISQERI